MSALPEMCEYMACIGQDRRVAALDPFHGDEFLPVLVPQLNVEGRSRELVSIAKTLLTDPLDPSHVDVCIARAMTRDLGFIAASLQKHGIALDAVPNLESALLSLSRITDEVPRDTVTSYGTRNPTGQRMRTFTGLPEERLFITSVARAMHSLPSCLNDLESAGLCAIASDDYKNLLVRAKQAFEGMVRSIIEVKRNIPPEIFSFQMRPYYPPLSIGGRSYFAPGGAQIILIPIDLALFGAEIRVNGLDVDYMRYVDDNVKYLPPEYRCAVRRICQHGSLIEKARAAVARLRSADSIEYVKVLDGLAALESMLLSLLQFRFPHKRVADENMRVRPPHSLGSGGYATDILEVLLRLTLNARREVVEMRKVVSA